jgi:hypothetical protein
MLRRLIETMFSRRKHCIESNKHTAWNEILQVSFTEENEIVLYQLQIHHRIKVLKYLSLVWNIKPVVTTSGKVESTVIYNSLHNCQ